MRDMFIFMLIFLGAVKSNVIKTQFNETGYNLDFKVNEELNQHSGYDHKAWEEETEHMKDSDRLKAVKKDTRDDSKFYVSVGGNIGRPQYPSYAAGIYTYPYLDLPVYPPSILYSNNYPDIAYFIRKDKDKPLQNK